MHALLKGYSTDCYYTLKRFLAKKHGAVIAVSSQTGLEHLLVTIIKQYGNVLGSSSVVFYLFLP